MTVDGEVVVVTIITHVILDGKKKYLITMKVNTPNGYHQHQIQKNIIENAY